MSIDAVASSNTKTFDFVSIALAGNNNFNFASTKNRLRTHQDKPADVDQQTSLTRLHLFPFPTRRFALQQHPLNEPVMVLNVKLSDQEDQLCVTVHPTKTIDL